MKKIFKNKKGDVFIPALVIITILVFSTMAYFIQKNNDERIKDLPIGDQAASLLRLYSEINNQEFYLEESSKYALEDTFKNMGNNAGFPEENSCKKTQKAIGVESLVIFNSECGNFNLEDSFNKQFYTSLKSYLLLYNSNYPLPEDYIVYQTHNGLYDGRLKKAKDTFNDKFEIADATYTKEISELKLRTLEVGKFNYYTDLSTKKQMLSLEFIPKKYPVEFSSKDSFYEHQFRLLMPKPDFTNYITLYSVLKSCKEKEGTCEKSIKSQFPLATITKNENIFTINTKTNPEIKLVFNPKDELPNYQEQIFNA